MRETPTNPPQSGSGSRRVLQSTSPRSTSVRDDGATSERSPRTGVGTSPLRRGGRVVQPPVRPLTAPLRKEDPLFALHPAIRRKLLSEQARMPAPMPEAAPDVSLPTTRDATVLAPASPRTLGERTADTANTASNGGQSRLRAALKPRGERVTSEDIPDLFVPARAAVPYAPDDYAPDDVVVESVQSVQSPAAPIVPASLPAIAGKTLPAPSLNSDTNMFAVAVSDPAITPVAEPQIMQTPPGVLKQSEAHRAAARNAALLGSRIATRWDRQTVSVGAVSLIAGIVAVIVSTSRNLLLQYPDARSHLEIARRVFDNRTPGLVQLGTVWLPVPHLLLLPFVNIDPLWTSGLAGSIVGVSSLVVTTVTLFLAVRQLTGRALPAWLAVLVLLTNPSLLYIQSIALTEPVLLASMTASAYFLLRWTKDQRTQTLLVAGIFAALAVGSRYDGWFFVVVSALALGLTVLMRRSQRVWMPGQGHSMETQGVVLAYATVPCYAIGLWFLYNWIYFGDPLEFQRGAFSAQQQQKALEVLGQLSTKNNLWLSTARVFVGDRKQYRNRYSGPRGDWRDRVHRHDAFPH